MSLDYQFANGKSQACAYITTGVRSLHLLKPFEYSLLKGKRYASSVVATAKLHLLQKKMRRYEKHDPGLQSRHYL